MGGGSSIGESSIGGDDHLNDLLGVLNAEERERYLYRGVEGMGWKGGEYGDGGKNRQGGSGGEYYNESYNGLKNNPRVSPTTPRREYVNDDGGGGDEREVRVSVVTPSKQQQRQNESSPTSIFSIFNCGDITNDISETLSLIFSPQKQQQREKVRVLDDDEDEEERLLMEKLQRLREKKWRGQSGGGGSRSSSRART
mmetsp:Transcript_13648/g.22360  ORF Transcript_13648/g.22360 Transcript_13648/m.22360 type:complete len:197 (+) Transcript_13648:899-1489(+)